MRAGEYESCILIESTSHFTFSFSFFLLPSVFPFFSHSLPTFEITCRPVVLLVNSCAPLEIFLKIIDTNSPRYDQRSFTPPKRNTEVEIAPQHYGSRFIQSLYSCKRARGRERREKSVYAIVSHRVRFLLTHSHSLVRCCCCRLD